MPIDELKTKFDKSAKKSKVSIPIKELKTNYEEPTKKIKQDAEGLEPISIRTKKTKKIPIDNQIQKETKTIKLFDDGIKKTYRRKNQYDPNQKYRRYKSKVEAKLYENLVGEPEQSIVEAIREATEQLKSPSIRKIIRDTNIDSQDLDTSEIRTENDVIQPKNQEEKRHQLLDAIEKRNPELKKDRENREKKAINTIEDAIIRKMSKDIFINTMENKYDFLKVDREQPFQSIMKQFRKKEGAEEKKLLKSAINNKVNNEIKYLDNEISKLEAEIQGQKIDYISNKNNDELNNKKANIIQNAFRNRLARKEFKKEKTIKDLNDTTQEKLQTKLNPKTRNISTQAGNTISTSEVGTGPRGRGRPSNRERVLYASQPKFRTAISKSPNRGSRSSSKISDLSDMTDLSDMSYMSDLIRSPSRTRTNELPMFNAARMRVLLGTSPTKKLSTPIKKKKNWFKKSKRIKIKSYISIRYNNNGTSIFIPEKFKLFY